MGDFIINCPKCNKPGVVNDTCPSCGVVVSRYLAFLAKKEQAARSAQTPANMPSAPLRTAAPEEKKSIGPLVPILIAVALLSSGYFGYVKYHVSVEAPPAPSETSATPSGDTQAAPSPDKGQPGEKAPGLKDRISAWFSGELKPAPVPVATHAGGHAEAPEGVPASERLPQKVAAPSNILTATDANFEEVVLHSATPVVVMFWADYNEPSQKTVPQVAKLANEFIGRIKFVMMNVESSHKTIDQYKINAYPTLIFFENGEVKKQEVGGGSSWLIWSELGLPGEPPRTDASARTVALNLINTTAQDFDNDVIKSGTPVIVEFWSSARYPELSNLLTPELRKLAAELNGRVKVVRLDVDECYKLTEQYNIGAVPALVLFENGSVTKKMFGVWPADKIKEKLGL
jgi:thioredoxin 1